jgi:hypothetical protein
VAEKTPEPPTDTVENYPVNGFTPLDETADDPDTTFILMETETIGDLRLSLTEDEVVRILGEPDEATEPEYWGADGAEHYTLVYPGIEVGMSDWEGEFPTVDMITIYETCMLKTSRGIGIGSSYNEVEDAYSAYIETTFSSRESIVAGSIYGGVIFTFADEKVISIFLGAAYD